MDAAITCSQSVYSFISPGICLMAARLSLSECFSSIDSSCVAVAQHVVGAGLRQRREGQDGEQEYGRDQMSNSHRDAAKGVGAT